ncbi:LysR family transcriptional regulator [Marinomonas piezotolerans]|uniref:LysR family transcriptional regulator n=1 Tax=Marinomonas piezotolerans TaxID=2213058 RepID=A0A370U4U6_9GAMM|nr:LysR family transcriptional regulator [Marinomonas piezotolerans]RDL42777.1 LysR family transcriptional regulator [Marinomonas piezotolerans]
MNYLAWKVFVDVCELGSLSKVAILWNTSQPQISRQIKSLEKEFACRLFVRNGRGVELTEIGRLLEPEIRRWLQQTEQLENNIRNSSGLPIGKVRLAILPSTASPWLSEVYKLASEKYPDIQLEVREGQGHQLESWLEQGKVDLALMFRHSVEHSTGDIYLRDTATFLVGSPNNPLTINDTIEFSKLDGVPLTSFCRPSSWRDYLEVIARRHDIKLNVVLEADSLSLQTHAVLSSNCYALLGAYASYAAQKSLGLSLSKVIAPNVKRYLTLSMSPHGQLTLAIKKIRELIKEVADKYPPGFE